MKKIIIAGGGVAGLCAGIYARKAGFDTVIYEKNENSGGSCSAWNRKGFCIDNCLHWLTGTKEGTPQYKLWVETGVIKLEEPMIQREMFYSSEYNGETITLWRDLDRTEKEMLELSPEDEKEIKSFIEYTRLAQTFQEPVDNPLEYVNLLKEMNLEVSRKELIGTLVRYFGLDSMELSKRFKHPLLQCVILDFMAKEYEAYWLVLAYSFFTAGNGNLPQGGSAQMAKNLLDTYISLGGEIHYRTPVKKVSIVKVSRKEQLFNALPDKVQDKITEMIPEKEETEGGFKDKIADMMPEKVEKIVGETADIIAHHKANGVYLENDEFVEADYVVCACDINYVFTNLVKKKYAPKAVKLAFKDKLNNPVYSSFQVAFSVDGLFEGIKDTLSFECEPIDVGKHIISRICVKNYRLYGDYIAPEGKTVIQCSIVQYSDDFEYWKKLAKNPERYRTAKKNTACAIRSRIESRFPEYEGKIHILDVWTPYTYSHRNNCYKGAYMRFITTATNRNAFMDNDIKGVDNIYLASHWLRYPGGVPMAALMGKVAIERIKRKSS